jgi:Tol biopolymer transport system component
MTLAAGNRLGPYEIVEPIGSGGMGEVYRARDTRLGRDVAVKVLPAHLSNDVQARQRLEREARAVSALSHPHICTLYDVGQEGDIYYLVIEYLEGESLAQRLAKGPLGLAEMLSYATQITDALDRAHRRGLLHRDLKPGNVVLTASGAKLLDFGLAKGRGAGTAASELTSAPTSTSPLTAQGTIVGTFQYMAPELLEGGEADARSEIFALGAVLYEMITGRKAFDARTQAGVIAAIIERDSPSALSVQPTIPPALDRLIATCLAKNPDDRRQSMHDVLLDLKWIAEGGSQAGVSDPVAQRRRRSSRLAWGVAALLAIGTAVLGLALWARPVAAPRPIVAQILFPADVRPTRGGLALSPDGRRVVLTARQGGETPALWLRDLDGQGSRRIAGTEGAWSPFWSPDGRSIGFFVAGNLKVIDPAGGLPLTVCAAAEGAGASWNDEGTILFAPEFGLQRVSASGGDPVRVTEPVGDRVGHVLPSFLPDGRHFLFTVVDYATEERADVYLGSLDGGEPRKLVASASSGEYAAGHIHYLANDTLIAQPFDLKKLTFRSDRRVLAENVAISSASRDGTLVYLANLAAPGSQLTWYDRDGRVLRTIESAQGLDDLTIAPDGSRLAVVRADSENRNKYDVWTYDLERLVFTRLTFDGTSDDPVFSPDGSWVAFAEARGALLRKRANGAGEAEQLLESKFDDVPHVWSRDGGHLLFSRYISAENLDLWQVTFDAEGKNEGAAAVLASPFQEFLADVSADGRWLAYASNESGQTQIYVMSWPDLQGKWQISSEGGGMPRWRSDGRELFFIAADRRLMAVEIAAEGAKLRIGQPVPLAQTRVGAPLSSRSHDWVAMPDGKVFIVIEPLPSADDQPASLR